VVQGSVCILLEQEGKKCANIENGNVKDLKRVLAHSLQQILNIAIVEHFCSNNILAGVIKGITGCNSY
jgi:hypothetical protein